jgi:acyl-CoA thioesterase FadM
MARISIPIPATLPFATDMVVRITDVNYGRHLGNDAMLGLIHEARVRFLRHHGMTEADVEGKPLVLADAAIVYRAEAFAGDRLRFEVGVGDCGRVGCDLLYRVTRPADGRLVAEAKTGLVFLDPATRRPSALPASLAALATT